MLGALGVVSPSSLFWSENELQWAISLGNTSLPYAHPGLLFSSEQSLLPWQLLVASLIKLLAIAITVSAGFPGGIIFPLFFAGSLSGAALALVTGASPTVGAVCFMAALMGSVLRTPWSGVLIVLLTVAGETTSERFIETFPLMVVSVMASMVVVYHSRLFGREQHGRRDLIPTAESSSDDDDDDERRPSRLVSSLFNPEYGDWPQPPEPGEAEAVNLLASHQQQINY